jgi:hypothetical protein
MHSKSRYFPLSSGSLYQSSSSGPFVLDHSEVRFSRLLFQRTHRKKFHMTRLADELPVVVQIPKDPESIDVRMNQPRNSTFDCCYCDEGLTPCAVELGAPAYAQVTLTTGRNQISHATLKFSSHPGIKFNFLEAYSADESEPTSSLQNYLHFIYNNLGFSLISAEDRLTIMNVPEKIAVTFFLPHSDASTYSAIVSMNNTPQNFCSY